VLVHKASRATLHEIETHWSLDDLVSAHLALDVVDELDRKVAEEQKRQSEEAART
jgi:ABC-type uncharacterized transport system substrate-binding protein